MELTDVMYEGSGSAKDRDTAVIEPLKCTWKEAAENPNSTAFMRVKEKGPSDPNYKCFACTGVNYGCGIYMEFLEEMSR